MALYRPLNQGPAGRGRRLYRWVYTPFGAHGAAKIPVRGLKEEMVMMAHHAVPMNHQPQALMRGGEGIEKEGVVRIGVKDPLPPSPPLHHMIQRMVVFYADGSGHDDTFNESISCNKLHAPYSKPRWQRQR